MMVVDRWLMNNPAVTPMVALVVCLTLVFTVLCAKVVGCTLPMAAEKIGIDPAGDGLPLHHHHRGRPVPAHLLLLRHPAAGGLTAGGSGTRPYESPRAVPGLP